MVIRSNENGKNRIEVVRGIRSSLYVGSIGN